MYKDQIPEIVKKLEPSFVGFTAYSNRLVHSNGMELVFEMTSEGKTTVTGINAQRFYSIGCSFEKSSVKIFKDIQRRLMPEYSIAFLKYQCEKQKRNKIEKTKAQKLLTIASEIGGEVSKNRDREYSLSENYIEAKNVSIYESFRGYDYELHISIDYRRTAKIAKYLKECNYIEKIQNLKSDTNNIESMKSIAHLIDGEMHRNCGNRNYISTSFVYTPNVSIYKNSIGKYVLHIKLNYEKMLKLAKYFKESIYITEHL